MIIQIISVVLVLSVIVMIHEFGHLLSAKSIGIAVKEFSIGLGPALWKKQGDSTQYSVRCIPFGGYCLFDPDQKGLDGRGRPLSFIDRGPWSKIFVLSSGPVMNFVLGAILFTLVFSVLGAFVGFEPVIGEVNPDSPAMAAGILPGDRILAIDGEPLETWYDLTRIMGEKQVPAVMEFALQRGAETITLSVTPVFHPDQNRVMIGVVVDSRYSIVERVSPLRGIALGLAQTVGLIGAVFGGIAGMVAGRVSVGDNLAGPVAVVQIIGETASSGFSDTLYLTALLSINVGILNLLPIPALDGGRIIVYLVELVRRKPITLKLEAWINGVGFVLLISLMIILTFRDLFRIFGGD